jgi:hypothetical protein
VVPLIAEVTAPSPRVTWDATCGEIERYRDAATELTSGDEACDGWLIAVGRDASLGVAWQVVRLIVE